VVSGPRGSVPDCSEEEPLTRIQQRAVIGPLNSYLTNRSANSNSNLPQPRSSINTWSWYGEIFSNEEFWPEIELFLHSRSNESNDLLQSGRRFYCFINQSLRDYERLQEQRVAGSVSPELANRIFSQINSVGANDLFASMIARLSPYLSESNKLLAIQTIDAQVEIGSSDEIMSRRRWRHDALMNIISTHSGEENSPVILAAIEALGNNGTILEEQSLASLFISSNSPAVKSHIIRQYDDSLMISSSGDALTLFAAITRVRDEAQRNRYLRELYSTLQNVDFGSRLQRRDLATDTSLVPTATYENVISQIRSFTTDSGLQDTLTDEITRLRLISEGTNDTKPDNPTPPIASGGSGGLPPQGGGTLRPIARVPREARPSGDGSSLSQRKPSRVNRVREEDGINNIDNSKYPNTQDQALTLSGLNRGLSPFQQNPFGTKPNIEDDSANVIETGEEAASEIEALQATAPGEVENSPREDGSGTPRNNEGQPNNNFISTLGNALTNNPIIPSGNSVNNVGSLPSSRTAPATVAGSSANNRATRSTFPTRSANSPLGDYDSSDSSKDSEDTSSRRSRSSNNEELIREIRQITEDTSNLRDRIEGLDIPSPRPANSGTNQLANGADNNFNDLSADDNQVAAVAGNSSRRPASNSPNTNNGAGRGPASASSDSLQRNPNDSGQVENGLASATLPDQTLLSPYSDPTEQDLSKVIIVRTDEEKNLLRNYMAAKESLTCPELRFVQDFYEKHIDNFILSKRRRPWREYALLELDGMNFRFNYPGAVRMRQDIKDTCATLSNTRSATVGQSERAPASADDVELVPEEAIPAQEEQGIIKKFMLKLGL
jgi:hypothetical protein